MKIGGACDVTDESIACADGARTNIGNDKTRPAIDAEVKRSAMTIKSTKITRTTALAGAAGMTVAILVAATTLIVTQQPAHAFPAYAQRTDLHCSVCHVNPKGGGPTNAYGTKWFMTGRKVPRKKR
jgi:mono/diheme cytochrome c family protein